MGGMRILSYIAKACMSISHQSMPCIGKNFWDLLGAILLKKGMYGTIRFFWIMCRGIVWSIMRNETIRASNTYETFFVCVFLECTTCHIEILFRFPALWKNIRIITRRTGFIMRNSESSHISHESMNIFMKIFIRITRIGTMQIYNMKVLKTICTKNNLCRVYLEITHPYFIGTIREKSYFTHHRMLINCKSLWEMYQEILKSILTKES